MADVGESHRDQFHPETFRMESVEAGSSVVTSCDSSVQKFPREQHARHSRCLGRGRTVQNDVLSQGCDMIPQGTRDGTGV